MRQLQPSARALTVEEYLAHERESTFKHEYIAGEVFAMSPQGKRHGKIIRNIVRALEPGVAARGCDIHTGVVTRVDDERYYYPDVVVECPPGADDQVIRRPCIVVEVTSPSTRATDLREKTATYRSVATLHAYLVVEQKRRRVLFYTRRSATDWDKLEIVGDGGIDVACVACRLTLDEIYAGIEMPPIAVREGEDEYSFEDYERQWVFAPAERHY